MAVRISKTATRPDRRNRRTVRQRHRRDIADAADAAARALPGWAHLTPGARRHSLTKPPSILDRRFEQVAADMTREEGKTLPEAKGEVRRSINIFRYFAGEGARLPGMLVPSERDRVHMFALRKPIGVVGLITPWNFPSAIPAWKLAPALICGNTVVLKPARAAPLSAWRLVEALHEAGTAQRRGQFRGRAPAANWARRWSTRRRLKAISFTGSCPIGNWLHAEASKRRLRIQLEMGGKNPTIVLADADFTVRRRERGQRRVLFHRPEVHGHQPRHRGGCHLRSLRGGRGGAHAQAQGGRRHAAGHRDRPVRRSGANGYRAALHRDRPPGSGRRLCRRPPADRWRLAKGYFVEPTVFADVTPEMTIAREEIFGPVLAIMRAGDFEDAMRIANDIPFGLSASIQTTNLSRVFEFIYRAGSRPAYRQPAQRRRGVSAALRRHQGFQLRTQGTGTGGAGILQRLQNRLSEILMRSRTNQSRRRRDRRRI